MGHIEEVVNEVQKESNAAPEYKKLKVYCKEHVNNYIVVKAKQGLESIIVEGEDEAIFYTRAGQVGSYQGRKLIAVVKTKNVCKAEPVILSTADIKKIQKVGFFVESGYAVANVVLKTTEDMSVTKKILPVVTQEEVDEVMRAMKEMK